ncbi:hypothetical protein Scep_029975 [Stephania cephalantha]|uniref:Uncharacterized protein n=1 Tax=Stephania cephalantha TaxID=152367 RepID=A0AAP0HDY6_9MAGN
MCTLLDSKLLMQMVRPLRDDQDILAMMTEHDRVKNIQVYLENDETAPPLSFKMPQDNPNLGVLIA